MFHSSKDFKIKYKANMESSNKNSIRAWLAVPQNSNRQKINSFSVSPKPKKEYKDTQGNKILCFYFKDEKEIKIDLEIETTLWKEKIDLKEENFRIPNRSSEVYKRYTKSERFLEKTEDIKKLAKSITKNDDRNLSKLKFIFDHVVENFRYCYPVKKRGVKNLDLKNLKGDCGEYSSLFVAMCRSVGIPAKNQTGYVIFPKEGSVVEHGWASVYLSSEGWVDFDTQYASLENEKSSYFAKMDDHRIVFTEGFNIPLKPAIPDGFDTSYWNNLGLPLTKSSVQTLQPLVFVSKSKVNFKDSISLL